MYVCKKSSFHVPRSLGEAIAKVSQKINAFHLEFTALKIALYDEIKTKEISAESLAIAISSLPPDAQTEHKEFLSQHSTMLDSPESRLKVYNTVNKYSNYLNYGLVQQLANLFGSADVKRDMESYVSKISEFRRNTLLLLYAKAQHPAREKVSSDVSTLVTKHKWTNKTLEDVEQFRRIHACQYCLLHFIAIISSIEEGSVVLTWLIPNPVASYLRKRIMMTADDMFRESSITQVEIDGITLYSSTTVVRKGTSVDYIGSILHKLWVYNLQKPVYNI